MTLEDGSTRFVSWVATDAERAIVRQAFKNWKNLGIGLEFTEVADRGEAEVRACVCTTAIARAARRVIMS